MLRDFEDCIEIEHGKRKFNFDKIYAVFNNELNDKNRLLSKLKDKNKVLKHQKAKLLRSVRQYMEDKEITGLALQFPSIAPSPALTRFGWNGILHFGLFGQPSQSLLKFLKFY